mgnify:CR=1 FL=1
MALSELGANVNYYIPLRDEGYGLNKDAIQNLKNENADLVISVDCGINSIEDINFANELNLDFIITDHHEITGDIPKALAVINPKREENIYSFKYLAGVGTAFMLVYALYSETNKLNDLEKYLDIVAIGTVADIVPLISDNRKFVKRGLEALKNTRWIGIKQLLRKVFPDNWDTKEYFAYDIGYIIAPIFNAAGRLEDAKQAVSLFIEEDGFKCLSIIEKLLENNTERKDIQKKILELSGYSYAMFRRIFSILTETTLSEYIRARKLTEAAKKIRETDEKIIELAFEYGYDSPDSFGLAFKNFHGYTPSEVRKGKPFRAVSRVRLMLTVKGGNNMNITIQKKEAFKVAGINAKNIEPSSCPEVWKELFSKYSPEKLENLGNGQSYGMCHDMKNTKKINYMACYDVRDIEKAEEMGLEIVEVAAAEYAVVELTGKIPDSIHAGWKYVFEVFFPEQGYRHSGKPDFEVYLEGDMYSETYKMELWIPIVKE